MSTERIFTQRVAMLVPTFEQWGELWLRMNDLGYRCHEASDRDFPWLAITDSLDEVTPITDFAYVSVDHELPEEYIKIDEWNPDLFVAIAAMSSGDALYPGEWVWDNYTQPKAHFSKVISTTTGPVKVETREGFKFIGYTIHESFLSKASVEDLILQLPVQKPHQPEFVVEYVEQSFFEENIAKELSGHPEKNWVEEMEDGDNAEQILDQARTFADNIKLSKAITEWTPQANEPIWVWDEGELERRKMRFAFFTETNKVAAYPEDYVSNTSNINCSLYDCLAKIDAPLIISPEEFESTFSSIYGVPASLIQIGKTDEP